MLTKKEVVDLLFKKYQSIYTETNHNGRATGKQFKAYLASAHAEEYQLMTKKEHSILDQGYMPQGMIGMIKQSRLVHAICAKEKVKFAYLHNGRSGEYLNVRNLTGEVGKCTDQLTYVRSAIYWDIRRLMKLGAKLCKHRQLYPNADITKWVTNEGKTLTLRIQPHGSTVEKRDRMAVQMASQLKAVFHVMDVISAYECSYDSNTSTIIFELDLNVETNIKFVPEKVEVETEPTMYDHLSVLEAEIERLKTRQYALDQEKILVDEKLCNLEPKLQTLREAINVIKFIENL